MRYVTRQGRQIAVETLPGINAPHRRRKDDQFAKVPMRWAAEAVKATKAPEILVCVDLQYRAWKAKGQSFVLPNRWLEENGVSRKAKSRILRDLEAADLIKAVRRKGKNPRITLT
jgi:hypothetical protein